MKLVIGGRAQGKQEFVRARYNIAPEEICDGETCPLDRLPRAAAVGRLHLLVRRLCKEGIDPLDWILRAAAEQPDLVWISDEIGCGVVPAEPSEREWREAAGRTCCALAQRAERVTRVLAGIPMELKGE